MTVKVVKVVKAKKVRKGDVIPGLDNGYVYEEPEEDHQGLINIGFHDAEGYEGLVQCTPEMPITIERST